MTRAGVHSEGDTLPLPSPPPPAPQAANSVVLWDKVVRSRAEALVQVKDAYTKYPLLDQGKDLRGTPMTLTLHWDVMPITGMLYADTRGNHTVRLPGSYCAEADGESAKCPALVAAGGGAR